MKNTARIMFRVGRIYNILMFVLADLLFLIGVISILTGIASDTTEAIVGSSSYLIFFAIYLIVLSVVSLNVVGKKQRQINLGARSNSPFITIIIIGALASNPFYVLCGIFGLIAFSQESHKQAPAKKERVIEAAPVQQQEVIDEEEEEEIEEDDIEEAPVIEEKQDNFYVDVDTKQNTNSYGDIIVSVEEFKQMLSKKNVTKMTMGNIQLATVGNSFSMSGMNISNDSIKLSINGIKRVYDTNEGIKGILIDGNKVYLGVKGVANTGVGGSEEQETTVSTFKLDSISGLSIKIGSGSLDMTVGDEKDIEVACGDGLNTKVENGILVIDAENNEDGLEIAVPEGSENLSIDISATSGTIDISDVTCSELTISATSGSIDGRVNTNELTVSITSGTIDLTQSFSADGSATLSSTSGSIDYNLENVSDLDLSVAGEYDNDYEEEEDGFKANVTISTRSGYISIG